MKQLREFLASARVQKHLRQGIKFCFTGGLAALSDLATLTILVEYIGMSPELSFVISTGFAVVFVFFMNKYFTFKDTNKKYGGQLLKFAIVYSIAIASNLGISYALLWAGVHYLIARIVAIGIGAAWNYTMSHGFIFKETEPHDEVVF